MTFHCIVAPQQAANGEHFVCGALKIAVGVLGFAAMVIGVVFLPRIAPWFAATPTESPAVA
jgi:hypothetical protein